ncbi:MAG: hypothetical protein HY317_05315 [Acidobacteria bacterium]|nr:hypothetical protein [Acidobacteriota bacterium]
MTRNGRRGLLLAAGAIAAVLGGPRSSAAACGVTSADLDGNGSPDLKILGTTAAQTLTLIDNGTDVVVSLNCNTDSDFTDAGELDSVPFAGVETLIVSLGGRDTITYTQAANLTGVHRGFILTLGPYGNTLTFTNPGFAIESNSTFVLDVTGASHADTLTFDYAAGTVDSSVLVLRGDLSAGPDVVSIKTPSATNAHVELDLGLGLGLNVMNLEIGGALAGTTTLRSNVEGGDVAASFDDASVTLGGAVGGSARVLTGWNLRTGADRIEATFDQTGFGVAAGGEVRLRASGGVGDDDLVVHGTTSGGPSTVDGLVEVVLRGGPGVDTVNFDWYGMTGTGTCRLRAHGGVQPDAVLSAFLADASSANVLDFAVQGGRGDDLVYSAVFDPSGALSYAAGGSALLDGASERDVCVAFGDGVHETVNCEPIL